MLKKDFQQYKKDKRFPTSIFQEYFQEVCDVEWNEVAFSAFVDNQSFFNNNYLADIINNIIIPYYNNKFKIYEVRLLDEKGVLIMELNEITEED